MSSSRAEEIRSAILRLRAADKFVIAHSQGFMASGPAAYRAISAADEIWIQPGVDFEMAGISFESLFLGDALRKVNVTPEIEQLYEYKGAVDVYKGNAYSMANAEAMTALAESVWAQSMDDIAADRKTALAAHAAIFSGGKPASTPPGLDEARLGPLSDALRARFTPVGASAATAPGLRQLLEESPYSSEEAVVLGLADRLGWPEEAAEAAEARAKGELVWIGDYVEPKKSSGAVIAIVGGEGEIITGPGGGGGILDVGSAVFASDRVAADLLALAEDDSVDAVVFRVDSPGGSASASDQVWRAVERLQEAGKPVVVSMGEAAASGGYYVSAGARAIVANRATITGSIGVFGGKFAIADGLRMIGVSPDTVAVGGDFATAWSTEKLTNSQRARLLDSLEGVYDRFTSLVATGRKLPKERVLELAKGRIWSGADAQKLGLVDKTGGLIEAIEEARTVAGFTADEPIQIRLETPRASPLDLLQGIMVSAQAGAVDPGSMQALATLARDRRSGQLLRQIQTMSEVRGPMLWHPPVQER
jgi:protease IV